MQTPGKIENMQEKINAKAKKMLYHGIGNFVWASGSRRGEVCGSREKFSKSKGKAKRRMWIGGTHKGSFLLCNAKRLTGRQ